MNEEQKEYGYDYAFTPVLPDDPEYRQAYQAAQLAWLEQWVPNCEAS
ncbi:MAG: hypothetical protein ACYC2K_01615 [Gemmatimonadales bacterium]